MSFFLFSPISISKLHIFGNWCFDDWYGPTTMNRYVLTYWILTTTCTLYLSTSLVATIISPALLILLCYSTTHSFNSSATVCSRVRLQYKRTDLTQYWYILLCYFKDRSCLPTKSLTKSLTFFQALTTLLINTVAKHVAKLFQLFKTSLLLKILPFPLQSSYYPAMSYLQIWWKLFSKIKATLLKNI